ncbi:hypothetical protein EDC82_0536 [Dermacoccus sp. SAI-028]|uniref:hypothetical protein n=1 Tax=Dermacoccus sp. SAI-028 TaxID=2768432 RepID=UPI001049E65D|nr:hypothetical protein [Dermacoccus sp. SAI-028]TCJ90816.1 hypothetical protein EDC82_0536 [Dermacoccus sp. SAI-028]
MAEPEAGETADAACESGPGLEPGGVCADSERVGENDGGRGRDEAEDIAEQEGLPQVSYDPNQQARLDCMLQVRPLIGLDPSQMSEQAANEAAAQLRTLLANRP